MAVLWKKVEGTMAWAELEWLGKVGTSVSLASGRLMEARMVFLEWAGTSMVVRGLREMAET
jgi:hypothetical protein